MKVDFDRDLANIQEKQLRELVRKAHLGNEEARREYLELIGKAFLSGDCYNHLLLKYVLESVDRELLQDKIVALHEEIEKLKNGG